jgi:xylulokinase
MAELLLAHDLGTTGNKASLFDASGRLLASAFEPYGTAYPQPGWAEQDPADWWRAICTASQRLFAESNYSPEDVAGIGFSGQMMCCLPVDGAGRPLRSGIIWADTRSQAEAALLAERVGAETVYHLTGHRPSPNDTASKQLWLRSHQPEI